MLCDIQIAPNISLKCQTKKHELKKTKKIETFKHKIFPFLQILNVLRKRTTVLEQIQNFS